MKSSSIPATVMGPNYTYVFDFERDFDQEVTKGWFLVSLFYTKLLPKVLPKLSLKLSLKLPHNIDPEIVPMITAPIILKNVF